MIIKLSIGYFYQIRNLLKLFMVTNAMKILQQIIFKELNDFNPRVTYGILISISVVPS